MGLLIRDFKSDFANNYTGKYDSICKVVRKKTIKGAVECCYFYARRAGYYVSDTVPSFTVLNITVGIYRVKADANAETYSHLLSICDTEKKVDVFWRKSENANTVYVEVVVTTADTVYISQSDAFTCGEYPITSLELSVDASNGSCTGSFNDNSLTFTDPQSSSRETELSDNGIGLYFDIIDKIVFTGEYCRTWFFKIDADSKTIFDLPMLHDSTLLDFVSRKKLAIVGNKSAIPPKLSLAIERIK